MICHLTRLYRTNNLIFKCVKSLFIQMSWKRIPGYDTKLMYYESSTDGEIRSVRKSTGQTRVLSKYVREGYYKVKIGNKTPTVHTLVALAHIKNSPDSDGTWTVDHITSTDKLNNCVDNLRWANGKQQNENRSEWSRIQIDSCPVIGICKTTGVVVKFESASSAEILPGVYRRNITSCLTGRLKTCGGYVWTTPDVLPDLPGELWKLWNETPQYNVYVSDKGRFSYEFVHGYVKKLSPEYRSTDRSKDEDRYPTISKDAKEHKFHNAIYECFVGPIPEGMIVHHRDNDKQNACLDNLELVTRSQNSLYARADGRYDDTKSARKPVIVDGVSYTSCYDASKAVGDSASCIRHRVISSNYSEYQYDV